MFRITVISITCGVLVTGSTLGSIGRAIGTPVMPGADVAVSSIASPATPDARRMLLDGHQGPDHELIEWAIDRFEQIELDVPAVRVVIDPAHALCEGVQGRFVAGADDPKIVLCLEHRDSHEAVLHRRRTIVHELAHAWDHATLSEHDRFALQPVLGVETWYGTTADWEHRGAERLAETLVWGLYDQLRRPVLVDVPCDELHRNFEAVTGHRPLGPIESLCEPAGPVPHASSAA